MLCCMLFKFFDSQSLTYTAFVTQLNVRACNDARSLVVLLRC